MRVNGRFSSNTGHFKSKDSGDQREASALRDEVCASVTSMKFSFAL